MSPITLEGMCFHLCWKLISNYFDWFYKNSHNTKLNRITKKFKAVYLLGIALDIEINDIQKIILKGIVDNPLRHASFGGMLISSHCEYQLLVFLYQVSFGFGHSLCLYYSHCMRLMIKIYSGTCCCRSNTLCPNALPDATMTRPLHFRQRLETCHHGDSQYNQNIFRRCFLAGKMVLQMCSYPETNCYFLA